MFKNITKNIFKGIGQLTISSIRSIAIVALTVTFLILNIDKMTDSQYGVNNLVIIASSFVFFPTFFVLFTEIFLYDIRKKRKNIKNEKEILSDSEL